MNIYFDMDGTLVDLYGVDNWLEDLRNESTRPYEIAKPLINMNLFARYLNRAKAKGHKIHIISWVSKTAEGEVAQNITRAKKNWLAKHLKSVEWNEIYIVEYGKNKNDFCKTRYDILFDDEVENRKAWQGVAFDENYILELVKTL